MRTGFNPLTPTSDTLSLRSFSVHSTAVNSKLAPTPGFSQNSQQPIVTIAIVIPVKEVRKSLARCLQSIQGQTYPPAAVIVVADHPDPHLERLQEMYGFMLSFCLQGKSAARNFGAALSQNSYILHLDDDMILDPSVLNDCVRLVRKTRCQAVAIPEYMTPGRGLLDNAETVSKNLAGSELLIEAPRFISRRLYLEIGGIDPRLDPIDEGDLKAKLEEHNISYRRIHGRIQIVRHEQQLSVFRRWQRMYSRGQKAALFNTLHPRSAQLRPSRRLKQFLNHHHAYLWRHPITTMAMIALRTVDFTAFVAGRFHSSRLDRSHTISIRNRQIFDHEAATYQPKFYQDTLGAQYVNAEEKNIVLQLLHTVDRQLPIKILDTGAGGGRWSKLLLEHFPQGQIVACDSSAEMVKGLKKKFDQEPRFRAIQCDMARLPFEDATFDIVVNIRAMKYAADQVSVMNELQRVLARTGIAVIELPYASVWYRLLRTLPLGGSLTGYARRIYLSSRRQIEKNLQTAHLLADWSEIYFTLPSSLYTHVNTLWLLKILRALEHWLPRRVFGRSWFLRIRPLNTKN